MLNVVRGDKEAVDGLLQAPEVKTISSGNPARPPSPNTSTAEGTQARQARVQALGGAKNHAVLMPDADLDNAVSALMGAAYGSCGERCMAISVAVCVGDQVADALIAKLVPQIKALKIGAGTSCGLDMGPLVTAAAQAKVTGYIDSGVAQGAELVVDGRGYQVAGHENGFFLGGSLFDRVTPEMTIYKEEIFGPVLCVVRVNSLEEAMQLINDHEYGNGTCIFTRDGEAAPVLRRDRGRHGRRQRPAAGAGGLPQLRRLEALAVRRPPRLRPGRRALLHPAQGHHPALAAAGQPAEASQFAFPSL
ncbi:aldehyde dehydrogenase family protein [Pseudomonas aeruginosa]|nr:aldehyde dehydrogenase family protein [Pseudomonas aeruginosa]